LIMKSVVVVAALLPGSAVQLAREVALAGRYAGFLALPAEERMPQAALAFDVAFSVDVVFSADNAENTTRSQSAARCRSAPRTWRSARR
jgi:hypothetical protein